MRNIYYILKGCSHDEEKHNPKSGGFDGMVEHKYDTKGNCIEEKEYDAQNMTSKRIYEYNEAGSVTLYRLFFRRISPLSLRYSLSQ